MIKLQNGWKTSLAGLISAAAGFVAFSPGLFQKWPWVMEVAKYIMVGGLSGIGLLARDAHSDPQGTPANPGPEGTPVLEPVLVAQLPKKN